MQLTPIDEHLADAIADAAQTDDGHTAPNPTSTAAATACPSTPSASKTSPTRRYVDFRDRRPGCRGRPGSA